MAKDLSRFIEEVRYVVSNDEDRIRLDHFLVDHVFWRSRTDLQARVRRGGVKVNGAPGKASLRVRAGDTITIEVRPEDLPDQNPETIDVRVLHEDNDLIVVDKQPGLLVHPTGRHVYDTLMNALHLRYRVSGEIEMGISPHVVHRLDRNTSGVLVVAKTAAAKHALQAEFESRRPEKTYIALVEGSPDQDGGTIDLPIGHDPDAEIRLKMKAGPGGQPSRTEWEVVERFEAASLVRARILTGRQHQIRVHMAAIGHAVLADPLYGDPRSVAAGDPPIDVLERQALHAARLKIAHPTSNEPMVFESQMPIDMQRVLTALRDSTPLTKTRDGQSGHWQ